MKLNIDEINQLKSHIENGNIITNRHPTYPLTIYNYSRNCQYDNCWDEITLMCRGLVLDDGYNIVARPFKKFFNLSELTQGERINFDKIKKVISNYTSDVNDFIVYDKMDGSLIIVFEWHGELFVNSRGSWNSQQAIKAKELLGNKLSGYFLKNKTVCFEVIYPENRIVVDYGNQEKLILLGVIDNDTGRTISDSIDGFESVNKKYYRNFDKFLVDANKNQHNNEEGYVVYYHHDNFRFKFKFNKYMELHHILSDLNRNTILTYMKDFPEDLFNNLTVNLTIENILVQYTIPDEFFEEFKSIIVDIIDDFQYYLYMINMYRDKNLFSLDMPMKEIAQIIKNEIPDEYHSFFFDIVKNRFSNKKVFIKMVKYDS